jgi:hypothetical protein
MIDDMTRLKQAMEQMDAEDPAVAQAAKDRAAQTLSDARLSFSKMAELIEQRRLLLRPRIVAGIKRMDQPGMLGDAAFRDTGSALRREGQSFRQIAEAIELAGRPAPHYEDPVQNSEPWHQIADEPGTPAWLRALAVVASIVFFPLRHPIRFLALVILLFYALRGLAALGEQASGYFDGVAAVRHSADQAMSSVSSFVNEHILRRSSEATAQPPPPGANPVRSGRGAVAAVLNAVSCSCCRAGSPPNRALGFAKCTGSSRTSRGHSRSPIGWPFRSTGFSAASRHEGQTPVTVRSELWRSARGLLSLVWSPRSIRRRSPARFRRPDTGRDPPQFPHGGAVCRWRRRLLLGRSSILSF